MKELRLLIGGSPCTFWSIAQTKHRETKPSGMGWELFLNYLIAKEKFKPDLFLYENNVSADPSIKEEIKKDLGVDDFALLRGEESPASYVEINSALVSAQSRKRFYVHNCGEDMPMPKDRGILLKDILETGGNMSMDRWYESKNVREGEGKAGLDPVLLNPSEEDNGKSRTIKASYNKSSFANFLRDKGFDATGVAEEVRERKNTEIKINENGLRLSYANGHESGTSQGSEVKLPDAKAGSVTTSNHGRVFEPICLNPQSGDFGGSFAGKGGQPSVQNRVYSDEGKSTALTTSFNPKVAEPMPVKEATAAGKVDVNVGQVVDLSYENSKLRRGRLCDGKCHTLMTGNEYYQYLGTKERPVYEVKDGQMEIKGKKYPIRLKDGKYIIRKLSVTECERLQTMPDGYTKALPASKAYKALGNGWTAEVVIHILGWGLRNVPRDTKIKVLSMYDGIATGRYVLDRLGFENVEYHAYEIDKDPIKAALDNYPDIIEHGDAFQVRKEDWSI